MKYQDYLTNLPEPTYTPFLKLAEKKSKRDLAKDLALVGGGTALGAGLGYATSAAVNKRYGETLAGMSPAQRLRFAVPASAGGGGLLALAHVLRQRADAKRKDRD